MNKIPLEIVGLSANPTRGGSVILLLKETFGERRLPIIIGKPEADAIEEGINNRQRPRPMTHDLIKSIIEYLSATVIEVIIDELRAETFYAKIVLEIASMNHQIDSRPSDAIAIAVRFNAPIYCYEDVLIQGGTEPSSKPFPSPFEHSKETSTDEVSERVNSKLEYLKLKLREALANEDYERAAKLRDEIKKIEPNSN